MEKEKRNLLNYIIIVAVAVIAEVLLDQLTKLWITNSLVMGQRVDVIGKVITFTLQYNDGAAFSIGSGASIVFFVVTLLGIPLFVYLLMRARTRSLWGQIGFTFIIGGTIGNAIDRAFIQADSFFGGSVRDFISFGIPNDKGGYLWQFATFNVADSFIVVGVILAILAIMFFDKDALFAKGNDDEND